MKTISVLIAALSLGVAGCQREAPADPCVGPPLALPASPDTYAGRRELARSCIKSAVYEIARKGAAVTAVADAAVSQCASKEADVVTALKATGPVYPYQTAEIHEDLSHLAQVTAVRARSKGCGAAADALLQSKP